MSWWSHRSTPLYFVRSCCFISASSIIADIGCQILTSERRSSHNNNNNNNNNHNNNNIKTNNDSNNINNILKNMTRDFLRKTIGPNGETLYFHFWDAKRSLIMGTSAMFVTGPVSCLVNLISENCFPGTNNKTVIKKMIIGFCISPFMISLSFLSITLLKGKTVKDAEDKMRADLLPTVITGFAYWPFLSFLSLKFLRFEYRPVFNSVVGAIWQMYLSSQINKNNSSAIPTLESSEHPITTDHS